MAGGSAADNPDKRRKLCFPYLHKRRSPRRTSRRASPRSAVASSTTAKLPEANEQCIKLLENPSKKIDDCQKAPSPILPAKNEIIWGSIAFVALLLALYKFAWPGLKGSMDARAERIRSDLDAADTA